MDKQDMVRELKIAIKHRVTRLDFCEAVLEALVDTHPKIKRHPAIRDFLRREEECDREKRRARREKRSARGEEPRGSPLRT